MVATEEVEGQEISEVMKSMNLKRGGGEIMEVEGNTKIEEGIKIEDMEGIEVDSGDMKMA